MLKFAGEHFYLQRNLHQGCERQSRYSPFGRLAQHLENRQKLTLRKLGEKVRLRSLLHTSSKYANPTPRHVQFGGSHTEPKNRT